MKRLICKYNYLLKKRIREDVAAVMMQCLVGICLAGSFLLFNGGRLSAQQVGFHILNEAKVAEIPFRKVNNLIVVPVMLNDLIPLQFIIDTGVRTAILTDRLYSDVLNVSYDRKLSIKGAGNLVQVDAFVASNISFLLPNVKAKGQTLLILEEDYLQLGKQLGTPVHGIIGFELFRDFVVKVEYQKEVITLYKPTAFKASRRYTRLPLQIVDGKPYFVANLQETGSSKKKEVNLLVDTGASHALLLHQNDSADRFELPGETIYGSLGRGIMGNIEGHIGRVHGFSLQDFCFEKVLTSFPEDSSYANISEWSARDGTVGGELLNRFTVIFDYPNEAIYLRKNRNFREPFVYSKTGLVLIAEGNDLNIFKVVEVRENTPAAEAGIQQGDILLKLNGIKAKYLDLLKINEKFRRREGKKIRLKLKRGEEEYKTSFRLRNII